jgi:hypothetical protein
VIKYWIVVRDLNDGSDSRYLVNPKDEICATFPFAKRQLAERVAYLLNADDEAPLSRPVHVMGRSSDPRE